MLLAAGEPTTSTIGTIALFASVIGVIAGWLLTQIGELIKWGVQSKIRKKADQKARVLGLLHSAEELSAAANGVGISYAARADGKTVDAAQLKQMVDQLNEQSVRVDRARLEIKILGPKWAEADAVAIVNESIQLNAALRTAESKLDKSSFAALGTQVNKFKDVRGNFIDTAVNKLS